MGLRFGLASRPCVVVFHCGNRHSRTDRSGQSRHVPLRTLAWNAPRDGNRRVLHHLQFFPRQKAPFRGKHGIGHPRARFLRSPYSSMDPGSAKLRLERLHRHYQFRRLANQRPCFHGRPVDPSLHLTGRRLIGAYG